MSIFVSKQILRAPGDGSAGGWQLLLSLPPWDGYRTTPWTRRKDWCLTLLIFCRDFPCLSTSRDPWPHKEQEQLSCAGHGKHCILLALCLINTACQSQKQLHPMTSFLGPHAMSKAVILFFLLPYLGLHTCHLPLRELMIFFIPQMSFVFLFKSIVLEYDLHTVKLVYSSIHSEKFTPPSDDTTANCLSLKMNWCTLFV